MLLPFDNDKSCRALKESVLMLISRVSQYQISLDGHCSEVIGIRNDVLLPMANIFGKNFADHQTIYPTLNILNSLLRKVAESHAKITDEMTLLTTNIELMRKKNEALVDSAKNTHLHDPAIDALNNIIFLEKSANQLKTTSDYLKSLLNLCSRVTAHLNHGDIPFENLRLLLFKDWERIIESQIYAASK